VFKNLIKKFKKENKGAPIIEMLVAGPILLYIICFGIHFLVYSHNASVVNTITNDLSKSAAQQLRGSQNGLSLTNPVHSEYISQLAVDQIVSYGLPKSATIFKDEEGKKVSKEELKTLILMNDKAACSTKIEAKEDIICIYSETVTGAVVDELVMVKMYSGYDFFPLYEPLNLNFKPEAAKPLELLTPNPNF
jgi:hypothetical protein